MQIVITGEVNGDTVFALPPVPIDARWIDGPISKARREDLQAQRFVHATTLLIDSGDVIELVKGNDPPDRVVRVGGSSVGLELSELTIAGIREELSRARMLARRVSLRLLESAESYAHLSGRAVRLFVLPDPPLPKNIGGTVEGILDVLREDRGCVGDDLGGSSVVPTVYPSSPRGFYPKVGPVITQVVKVEDVVDIQVIGTVQSECTLSEVATLVEKRVHAKDTEGNDMLLLTCGLPDEKGYVCPMDEWLFRLLLNVRDKLTLSPKFIRAVFVQNWLSMQMIELFRSEDFVGPWPPKLGSEH